MLLTADNEHFPCRSVPDTVTMVLDMDTGSLGFSVAGQWLGWAATGLSRTTPLYPMASTVWGHCEVGRGRHINMFILLTLILSPR